jgi:formamidopyrimidine-DNA glycosylase
MPELPEVETIVRGLRPALTGRVIRRLLCRNPRTLDCGGGFRPRDICGHAIVEVSRRGKYVCVRL